MKRIEVILVNGEKHYFSIGIVEFFKRLSEAQYNGDTFVSFGNKPMCYINYLHIASISEVERYV